MDGVALVARFDGDDDGVELYIVWMKRTESRIAITVLDLGGEFSPHLN